MMAGRTARAALVVVTLAPSVGAAPPGSSNAHATPTSFEVEVPGGTARLAQAAGLDPATDAWRLLPDLTRRLYASFGERTGTHVAPQLSAFFAAAGRTAPPSTIAFREQGDGAAPLLLAPAEPHVPSPGPAPSLVPAGAERISLPLTPAAWDRILGRDRKGRPRDILTAIVVDGGAARLYRGLSTLDSPTLAALADGRALRTIYRRHPDAFAAFAASFRVEGGRVLVPGGHAEAALWQDLVGASVMRPGDFLVQLAAADQGRVFFLYDTIDRLDDAHRRFALAACEPDRARREQRVRALRTSFAVANPWWDAIRPPFSRPVADAPRVLEVARVTAEGVLAPPNRQLLWAAAFDDQVEAPPEWRSRLAQSAPADAAWLVERIATVDPNEGRSRLGMLAFAQRVFTGADAEADPADLLVALRGFGRYRALALALERMGLRDPSLYAAAVRSAEQIEAAGHGERARAALAQFQGTLVLVERAVAGGTLDGAAAGALVRSLAGVKLEDGRYGDRLASWIEHELLPTLRARLGLPSSGSAEAVVLRAMAGRARAATRLEWEGLTYDVDPAEAEYRRLRAIRRRQGGSTLEEVLAAGGADRESRLALVLTDLAYAAALGGAEGAPAALEDVARRHGFALGEPAPLGGPRPEWAVPQEVRGPAQRWHAEGALLGLDLALAQLTLRRLEIDVPPVPLLSGADRRGFAEGAVLVRANAVDDATRDRVAEGLRRGRARLVEAASDPAALQRVVADLRLRDWRRGALPSIAARDPAHLENAFTLGEERWLGGEGEPSPAAALWGTSARGDDGCLCARLTRPAPLDELAGRAADGRLAALSPDLHLRVADLLAEMKLPARLAPAILSLAVQDLMDEARPAYLDDAMAISRYARTLTRTRMEDYVSALVGRGPLAPVTEP
jgi:hypothetical protein